MMILIFCATVDATQWDVLFSLFPCATAASMAQRGLPGCAFWGGLLQWETPPCTAPMKAAVSLSRVYYSNFSVTKSINGDAVHYPSIEHIVALGILGKYLSQALVCVLGLLQQFRALLFNYGHNTRAQHISRFFLNVNVVYICVYLEQFMHMNPDESAPMVSLALHM